MKALLYLIVVFAKFTPFPRAEEKRFAELDITSLHPNCGVSPGSLFPQECREFLLKAIFYITFTKMKKTTEKMKILHGYIFYLFLKHLFCSVSVNKLWTMV
ncbi:hypothetical protein ACJROX_11655 [Pseudalkalibacillus sp. A8]|uniref:hypothetical protein n=1 Tax=Pseudalkalibacillus sp. A8 TaxID=3382641 RepID=UPI0038B61493